jgi:hypothetical protein
MHSGTSRSIQGVTFPARGGLPPGVPIEQLPVLGTSWYERRAGYWVRRVWLFVLMAIVVSVGLAFVIGFLAGIKDSSATGFMVVLVVEIAWSLAIVAYMMTRTFQRWNELDRSRPLTRRQRRAVGTGGALGALAQAGFVVGQFVLVIGSVLFFGLYVSLLIYTLLPEYPPEHKARLRLAEQLTARQQTHYLP